MITLQEAYFKAKSEGEKCGLTCLKDCRDFERFWGFFFMPSGEKVYGPGYITVNKKNGAISEIFGHSDMKLFRKSTSIPIEQFAEYNVAI